MLRFETTKAIGSKQRWIQHFATVVRTASNKPEEYFTWALKISRFEKIEDLHDSEGKDNMDSKTGERLKGIMSASQRRYMSELEAAYFKKQVSSRKEGNMPFDSFKT